MRTGVLEMDRCLEVQQPYHRTPESLAGKRGGVEFQVSGGGLLGVGLLGPSGYLWRGLGGYHPQ